MFSLGFFFPWITPELAISENVMPRFQLLNFSPTVTTKRKLLLLRDGHTVTKNKNPKAVFKKESYDR